MPSPTAAWGIEIGAHAIKAIRLEREGGSARVADFAVIPHKKVLTTPDLDRDEMVRLSLGQLISQKDLEGEHLVMSVPGHAAFARFAKLPPVEPKKVPDIVKFEAVQQIPFPIDQVEWDYETFTMKDSPEVEVGIFAITRERVQQMLGLWGEVGLSPEALTLSPVAVYNAMNYDRELAEAEGPVIFLDIGTNATDVVIAEEGRCWIRTFPLGGTHFTEAIASAFKLSYSKAEKLKLEAATSKYAKQIMQAMRPVFSDLLQDLQRSIGYYQSLHRDKELKTTVGLGSTFKIPGLRKFLGQQLQINVLRLDEFKRISMSGREAASFAEHTVNMATAYGLALQGIGLASIDANLVPVKVLREQLWAGKTRWFAAAAGLAIVASGMTLVRPVVDQGKIEAGGEPPVVRATLERGQNLRNQYSELEAGGEAGATATNMLRLLDYRHVWPHLVNDAATALASTDPQPELLSGDLEQMRSIPPARRRLVEMQLLDGEYRYRSEEQSRRIAVTLDVELTHSRPVEFLNDTVADWLRENAERPGVPYRIIADSIRVNPERLEEYEYGREGERRDRRDREPDRRRGGFGDPPPRPGASPPPAHRDPGGGGIGPLGPGSVQDDAPPVRRPSAPSRFGGLGPGGSPAAPSPPDRDPPPRRDREREPERRAHTDLDALAPIPQRPVPYSAGDIYYRVPVTFEIELLEDDPPATEPEPEPMAGRDREETPAS